MAPKPAGTLLGTLSGHTEMVNGVAWSPDSLDKTVHVWDGNNGHHLTTLKGHTNYMLAIAWSLDGRYLASGSQDQTVCVWWMG